MPGCCKITFVTLLAGDVSALVYSLGDAATHKFNVSESCVCPATCKTALCSVNCKQAYVTESLMMLGPSSGGASSAKRFSMHKWSGQSLVRMSGNCMNRYSSHSELTRRRYSNGHAFTEYNCSVLDLDIATTEFWYRFLHTTTAVHVQV